MSKQFKPTSKGKTGDTTSSPNAALAALSFEEALEQVESIIDRIERGEIGLEESLVEYERGVKLIQQCRQIHQHATQRVDELTQRMLDAATPSSHSSADTDPEESISDPADADDESEH